MALQSVTFFQRKLEKLAIAGETGAGKSTLMRTIAGLVQPEEGELTFERKRIAGPAERLVPGHPGIAYLSQQFELQKFLRVEQVLDYANTLSDHEASTLFEICQIDHLLTRGTDQLSGGERQRVAICRLLISAPRLLLLDEPFTHLDREHKETLKTVVEEIGERLRITIMLVSHDPDDTLSWADRILVMRRGKILQEGSPEEVYNNPVDEYTGGLFGQYNILHPGEFRIVASLIPERRLHATAEGRSLFFRPEHFKVVRKSGRALRAKVEKVSFLGSHWDARIRIGKKQFQLRTYEKIREGQICYLGLKEEALSFLREGITVQ